MKRNCPARTDKPGARAAAAATGSLLATQTHSRRLVARVMYYTAHYVSVCVRVKYNVAIISHIYSTLYRARRGVASSCYCRLSLWTRHCAEQRPAEQKRREENRFRPEAEAEAEYITVRVESSRIHTPTRTSTSKNSTTKQTKRQHKRKTCPPPPLKLKLKSDAAVVVVVKFESSAKHNQGTRVAIPRAFQNNNISITMRWQRDATRRDDDLSKHFMIPATRLAAWLAAESAQSARHAGPSHPIPSHPIPFHPVFIPLHYITFH